MSVVFTQIRVPGFSLHFTSFVCFSLCSGKSPEVKDFVFTSPSCYSDRVTLCCYTIRAVSPSVPPGAIRASCSAFIAIALITIHTAALLRSFSRSESHTCTTSLTMALSVLILASCSPPMFFPTQVMKVNLARLLIASPVVIRTKANRRASSEKEEQMKMFSGQN